VVKSFLGSTEDELKLDDLEHLDGTYIGLEASTTMRNATSKNVLRRNKQSSFNLLSNIHPRAFGHLEVLAMLATNFPTHRTR
jgi:hypothetical protein